MSSRPPGNCLSIVSRPGALGTGMRHRSIFEAPWVVLLSSWQQHRSHRFEMTHMLGWRSLIGRITDRLATLHDICLTDVPPCRSCDGNSAAAF
jgi:hypothetical protein